MSELATRKEIVRTLKTLSIAQVYMALIEKSTTHLNTEALQETEELFTILSTLFKSMAEKGITTQREILRTDAAFSMARKIVKATFKNPESILERITVHV